MGCSSREEIVEVFDGIDGALDFCGLSFDALTTPELLSKLEHFERAARRLRAPTNTPEEPKVLSLPWEAGAMGGRTTEPVLRSADNRG